MVLGGLRGLRPAASPRWAGLGTELCATQGVAGKCAWQPGAQATPTPVADLLQGREAHPAQRPGLAPEGPTCRPASLGTFRTLGYPGTLLCPGRVTKGQPNHCPSPLSAPPQAPLGAWASGTWEAPGWFLGGGEGWPPGGRAACPAGHVSPSTHRQARCPCGAPAKCELVSVSLPPPQAGPVHREALPLHLRLRWVSALRHPGRGSPGHTLLPSLHPRLPLPPSESACLARISREGGR